MTIDNLQELDVVSFSDYSSLINSFFELQNDKIRFRTFVQNYITSITVYRDRVVFRLDYGFGLLDDVTKEYICERRLFKTPPQRLNVINLSVHEPK